MPPCPVFFRSLLMGRLIKDDPVSLRDRPCLLADKPRPLPRLPLSPSLLVFLRGTHRCQTHYRFLFHGSISLIVCLHWNQSAIFVPRA